MKIIKNMFKFIRKYGMQEFVIEFYYRLVDIYYDKYFNVNTIGNVSTKDLGINNHESEEYTPIRYSYLFNILNRLPEDKRKSVLLEYGCGKGRVLVAAATYQYKEIIGLEISNLIDVSRNNMDKMKHRKAGVLTLTQCDAINFPIPPYVNTIYFFNPFGGSTLKKVVENIYFSYKNTPRKIFIIYFRNNEFDKIVIHQDWIIKIDQLKFRGNISCGLYETNL